MKYFLALLFLFALQTHAQVWQAPIREIAKNDLPDIAMASFDQLGPVIYYNPQAVQQAGPYAAAFFRAHEYGHHYLKHIAKMMFASDPYDRDWIGVEFETEADKYAFRVFQNNKAVLDAAIEKFEEIGDMTDGKHPTGFQRAENIRQWINDNNNSNGEDDESNSSRYIDCDKCDGTGIITQSSLCYSCSGHGELVCVTCLGTGLVHDWYGLTYACNACQGYGKLTCARCSGTGGIETQRNCWKCHGTGKIKR